MLPLESVITLISDWFTTSLNWLIKSANWGSNVFISVIILNMSVLDCNVMFINEQGLGTKFFFNKLIFPFFDINIIKKMIIK